jgi:hypothetical protein
MNPPTAIGGFPPFRKGGETKGVKSLLTQIGLVGTAILRRAGMEPHLYQEMSSSVEELEELTTITDGGYHKIQPGSTFKDFYLVYVSEEAKPR